MKRFLFLFLLIPFFSWGDFSLPYETYELKNGLQVILIPQEKSSLVSVQVYYQAGGIYEPKKLLGISHFLEHLMFKTTKNLKAGEYSTIIKSHGGYNNAATSYDYTTYYNILPANALETGIKLEAERMQNLTFDSEEVEQERKVIIEERHNRYENSPRGFLWENANEIFFKDHLYGRPVIGYEKTIKNIKISDLKEYYNTHYHPSKATLIVAGKFSNKRTRELTKKYFGNIPSAPNLREYFPDQDYKPQTGNYTFTKQIQTPYSMTLTKIPRANHPMIPSLFLLDYILYQGKNSILNQELVFKKKMCYSVGGGTYVRRMPSSFIFQFIPAPGIKPENVVKQWKKILRELKERKNLNQLIEKSRRFLLTGFYKDLETVEGISETIGWGTVLGSPDTLFDIYRKIDKLQTGDIRKAIDFILESPSATFTVKPGKGEKS